MGVLSSQTTARMGEWNLIRILRDGNNASLQLNDAETVNGTSPVSIFSSPEHKGDKWSLSSVCPASVLSGMCCWV